MSESASIEDMPNSWIDFPPGNHLLQGHSPSGLAGFSLDRSENYGKVNLARHLDNMAFRHRMSEREEEAVVFAMLALSNSPRSRSAYEAAQALAVEVGTSRISGGDSGTRQPLMGTLRMKASKAEAERIRKEERARETEWVRTHRLIARIAQMKILSKRTRPTTIHRMARKKIQWPTLCALKEQIKFYASHSHSEPLDIAFFYLATFPVDGATFDAIYDYLRLVKDPCLDFVDTYVDLVSSPFLKEKSFFVDSSGQHHPLPEEIDSMPFVSSQVSYFVHDLEEDWARGSRRRVVTCRWIQSEVRRLTAKH